MTDRKAIKRILERIGYIHVAGWVRKSEAKPIIKKITAAKPDVDKIRKDAENG